MTKVTYYMYSSDTCCMISGEDEMDGLDSVECQKSRKRIHWELLELLMRIRQKLNSDLLLQN